MEGFFVLSAICCVLSAVSCTPIAANEPTCPRGFTGYLEYPYNCYKFLQCDRGRTFVMNCGPGTAFNPSINVCDWPQNVPTCYADGEGIIDIR
ncbi:chondroitin proteoglycan 2 [Diachasma alloeum]|uniref:chondroitin proteoglycan 2 n=1 Tax=Diachasma alloeum TaxID=454923 RepID=UPI00073835DA|nr:chondroitin proteoglycan 2 [Diachasma alloeum]